MPDTNYSHSFSKDKQERLTRQDELLEHHPQQHTDLTGRSRLLVGGCGIGPVTPTPC